MAFQSNILEFKPNIPQLVSLRYADGRPCKTTSGTQRMMYSLLDGQTMFVPAYVGGKIKEAGIRSGQQFSICMKQSAGAATDYEITPLAPGPEPEIKFEGIQPQGAKPASGTLTTSQSQFMLAQLIAAIEVVRAAELHSVLIGRPVSFGSEDIRAFAISGFISRDREQGR